jgi:F-type H+-transporting ATPase subunit delta
MADVQAGKRYAQAAFELAIGEGQDLGKWRSDLNDIAFVLAESEAAPSLANGAIPLEQRIAVVDRILDIQPLALNLARLLVSKGRSLDARAVASAFERMADEHEGIVHAEVRTAVELSPQQEADLQQRLATSLGKRVRTATVVDPSLIGGLVVRVGDKLVDGSVRTRLQRLRRELEGVR